MEKHTQNLANVGSKYIQIKDTIKDIEFNVLMQYPTNENTELTAFGAYKMDVSIEGEIAKGKYPFIVLSHGGGGSHLLYRTISMALAKNGFVVALIEHFGSNRNDNHLKNTEEGLQLRPRHVSLTIDHVLADPFFKEHILADKIAMVGHSLGGFTALAVVGGTPRTKEGQCIQTDTDSRIKTAVLLAPAAGWFFKGLDKVTVPLLVLTAEHDKITPSKQIEDVFETMPNKNLITYREVKNAGHFSFLSPFPNAKRYSKVPAAIDPEGFDRAAFHKQLPQEIMDFLYAKLK